MRGQISQRGKVFLETARTLLHAAQNKIDQAIAGQLEALADDFQRQAERASMLMGSKALARWAASSKR